MTVAHSPYKVSAREVLRLPFPIELPELRPVDFNKLGIIVLGVLLVILFTNYRH